MVICYLIGTWNEDTNLVNRPRDLKRTTRTFNMEIKYIYSTFLCHWRYIYLQSLPLLLSRLYFKNGVTLWIHVCTICNIYQNLPQPNFVEACSYKEHHPFNNKHIIMHSVIKWTILCGSSSYWWKIHLGIF